MRSVRAILVIVSSPGKQNRCCDLWAVQSTALQFHDLSFMYGCFCFCYVISSNSICLSQFLVAEGIICKLMQDLSVVDGPRVLVSLKTSTNEPLWLQLF